MSVRISALPEANTLEVTDMIPISKEGSETEKIRYSQIVADMQTRHGSYNSLTNKPSINGVTLSGNLSTEGLGIHAISTSLINTICT